MLISAHCPPPLVRRRRPLKRGNYSPHSQCVTQRSQSQVRCLPATQRPANYLSRIHIEYSRQVSPLISNPDIGEIRDPLLVQPRRCRLIQPDVPVALIKALNAWDSAVYPASTPDQRGLAHQPFHTFTTNADALTAQGLVHSWATIDAPVGPVYLPHFLQQVTVRPRLLRLLTLTPSVIATP